MLTLLPIAENRNSVTAFVLMIPGGSSNNSEISKTTEYGVFEIWEVKLKEISKEL